MNDTHYFKIVEDGLIVEVGIASDVIGAEISKEEFDTISKLMQDAPTASSRLTELLEWVLLDDISDEEALSILTGESE